VSELRWAPPTRDDDADWAALLDAIEQVDHFGETLGPEEIDDEWASVWAHPETDSVFVWDGPALVAFGWLKTQLGQTKAHRVDLWGGVHPDHRRRGLGTRLLAWQLERAAELAAALDGSVPVSARITVYDHQHDLLALVGRAGLERVRTFLDMERPTSTAVPAVAPVEGLRLQPWSKGLDAACRAAHGDAFQDHWGSEPRSEEEWRQWYTGHRGFRPDLSTVAVDPSGAVAAFALSAAYPADWEAGVAPVEAWINSVGTRRQWRGQGVGRWVLADVLDRIAVSDTGFERAMLGVDAHNPTGAVRLYEALDFTRGRSILTYARDL